MNETPTPLSAEETVKLTQRILDAFDDGWGEGPGIDKLFWRTDNKYFPIQAIINCNDLFYWGVADGEEIYPDNIDLLESTFKEVLEISNKMVDEKGYKTTKAYELMDYAPLLFVARYRKQRPQVPYYKYFPDELKPLFDACGNEVTQYASEAYYDAEELRTGKKLEWRAKYKTPPTT